MKDCNDIYDESLNMLTQKVLFVLATQMQILTAVLLLYPVVMKVGFL